MVNSLGWRRVFSWKGRIGRRDFIAGYFGLSFLASIVGGIATWSLPFDAGFIGAAGKINAGVLAAACIPLSALVAQRVHDLGRSALWPLIALALLMLPLFALFVTFGSPAQLWARIRGSIVMISACVLLVGLLMLFASQGQKDANRFGPPPV